MEQADIERYVLWYSNEKTKYQALADKVRDILEEILEAEGIEYHTIQSRAKDIDSFKKKLENLTYPPDQMQDLAGVRIIGYVLSDIEKISSLIENTFRIDYARSEY